MFCILDGPVNLLQGWNSFHFLHLGKYKGRMHQGTSKGLEMPTVKRQFCIVIHNFSKSIQDLMKRYPRIFSKNISLEEINLSKIPVLNTWGGNLVLFMVWGYAIF